MDLFGPSTVRSYRGNRYTLVIVDDYSSVWAAEKVTGLARELIAYTAPVTVEVLRGDQVEKILVVLEPKADET
ncbi:hypothetical protein Tco_0775119 [Tanacetum coccineum]